MGRWIAGMAGVLLGLGMLMLPEAADAAKPFCGDNRCTGQETPASCPIDCDSGGGGDVCGDGVCGTTETCSSCSTDCGICPPAACNNDGICNDGEDCNGCGDCPGVTNGKPSNRYCCGLDTCDTGLCGANACSAVPVCGDGQVGYNEECDDGNTVNGDGCSAICEIEPNPEPIPANQFNIGDSIGEGEAANGTIGAANHDRVWSTGYSSSDGVNSLNERFDLLDDGYTANTSSLDTFINQAVSGAVMADFADQAQNVVSAAAGVPPGEVGMVTMLLGNNDVCASSLSAMTDPALFESQYRAGLDVLAASPIPPNVNMQISGIPSIYWLWESKRSDLYCRLIAWPFVPCGNLLDDAADDCASSTSRQDPDNIYPGDGSACVRRKTFHAEIRDTYNPILRDVLAEYQAAGKLENADYVDIMDVRFGDAHVNNGDCFHPSTAGHALMADEQWCRSRWGAHDPQCN